MSQVGLLGAGVEELGIDIENIRLKKYWMLQVRGYVR